MLCFVLALAFFEKSLLILPLLFLLTAWFFVDGGGLVRGILRTLPERRSRLVHLRGDRRGIRDPVSISLDLRFHDKAAGHQHTPTRREHGRDNLLPTILGGPWNWLPIGLPVGTVNPPSLAKWLSWEIAASVVVVSVLARKRAGRAWMILALYLVGDIGLLAIGRLAWVGPITGDATRYVADAVVPTTCRARARVSPTGR